MNVITRTALPGDLAALLGLYKHLNPDDPPVDDDKLEKAWDAIMSSGLTSVIVMEHQTALISSCSIALIPNLTRSARPFGIIENVVTHPDHRRKGYGGIVLKTALALAWEADCYKVMLATGSRREETLRFYEKAGFECGGKTLFLARREG